MITMTRKVFFSRGPAGRKRMSLEESAGAKAPPGRTPHVSKLMALAVRFDRLIAEGKVSDQSELARLAHVTQPRMTQIMNLRHLAPDIQEELLFLPQVTSRRDPVHEKLLRPLTAMLTWPEQRRRWQVLKQKLADHVAAKKIHTCRPHEQLARPVAPTAPLAVNKVSVRVNPGNHPASQASA